jgi:hypothetical protein
VGVDVDFGREVYRRKSFFHGNCHSVKKLARIYSLQTQLSCLSAIKKDMENFNISVTLSTMFTAPFIWQ